MKKGLVHIYTGNGKGKSTAAFGLAIRASGAGMRVLIQQFLKGRPYSELKAIRRIPLITLKQSGGKCFIKSHPSAKDFECALAGLADITRAIASKRYGLVIMDEVNVAIDLGLIETQDVIKIIQTKPTSLELVLTGRNCPRELYDYADYITEMREVKHPFQQGIKARRGIEH